MDISQKMPLEERIADFLIAAGVPAHMKGYQFLREAVKMAANDFEAVGHMTQTLYPGVAEKFKTSPKNVERSVRYAINTAWNRGRLTETIDSLFGVKVYARNEKPTNGEFIALVANGITNR